MCINKTNKMDLNNLKRIFGITLVCFLFNANFCKAQTHHDKCGIIVNDVKTQVVLGRNIGYILKLENTNEKTVDGISWTAFFYDRFGELKGTKEATWTSGNFIKPADTNAIITTTQGAWVKEADDIFITINKVHFIDKTTCK